jgi:hypothetical protein
MNRPAVFLVALLSFLSCHAAIADDIDRPGKGDWCYAPVRTPTLADKKAFVQEISTAAQAAEKQWGVPAPVVAAMSIVESGYATTRLAIKSNNIFAFKWPGDKMAKGKTKFVLWCQPDWDQDNVYPAFASHAEAVDFVAWRLSQSPIYAKATQTYQAELRRGVSRKLAAEHWLVAIAPRYNYKPEKYVPAVKHAADDPFGDNSDNLWRLEP